MSEEWMEYVCTIEIMVMARDQEEAIKHAVEDIRSFHSQGVLEVNIPESPDWVEPKKENGRALDEEIVD